MVDTELKPCPFCGGEAICDETEPDTSRGGTYHVSCSGDDCAGDIYLPNQSFWSREQAITAWNTRHSPVSSEEARQALEWLEDRIEMLQVCCKPAPFLPYELQG